MFFGQKKITKTVIDHILFGRKKTQALVGFHSLIFGSAEFGHLSFDSEKNLHLNPPKKWGSDTQRHYESCAPSVSLDAEIVQRNSTPRALAITRIAHQFVVFVAPPEPFG